MEAHGRSYYSSRVLLHASAQQPAALHPWRVLPALQRWPSNQMTACSRLPNSGSGPCERHMGLCCQHSGWPVVGSIPWLAHTGTEHQSIKAASLMPCSGTQPPRKDSLAILPAKTAAAAMRRWKRYNIFNGVSRHNQMHDNQPSTHHMYSYEPTFQCSPTCTPPVLQIRAPTKVHQPVGQ